MSRAPLLPPPRHDGAAYRVDLVCMGNICRSPMAAVVLRRRIEEAGLDVAVVSSGTGGWHVGHRMDRRAAALLSARGYDASRHRAQQLVASWLERSDLVLVMDEDNLADVRSVAGTESPAEGSRPGRIRLFREFDPQGSDLDRAVPDPYYGGDDGFVLVLEMVERTCAELVTLLASRRTGG